MPTTASSHFLLTILFTNRLSIQSFHRCSAVQTRTQFPPRLEYGELLNDSLLESKGS